MPKLLGIALGAVRFYGVSGLSRCHQMVPVLLIDGGALVWFGIHKYRAGF